MRRLLARMPLALVLALAVAAAPAEARPHKGFYGVVPQSKLHVADFERYHAFTRFTGGR